MARTLAVSWVRLPASYALASQERDAFHALLTSEERARAASFHFDRDRNQFVVGRALARTLVGRARGVPRETVTFATNGFGCPYLVGVEGDGAPSSLHFNLSHTASVVACGIGTGFDFGVDVEDVRELDDLESLARVSFSRAEVASLLALPEPSRTRRFFDHWTLKEAYIKARRRGLSLPLDAFGFTLNEGHAPAIAIDVGLDDDACAWRFEQHLLVDAPAPMTLFASAVRALDVAVAIREITTASLLERSFRDP